VQACAYSAYAPARLRRPQELDKRVSPFDINNMADCGEFGMRIATSPAKRYTGGLTYAKRLERFYVD
jgi:hypothetical protein